MIRRLTGFFACFFACLLLMLTGCKQEKNTTKEASNSDNEPSEETAAAPSTEENPKVASSGPYSVSLDDYRRSLSRSLLSGRAIPKRTLADPAFQRSRARRLVMREVVREAAEERGIEISHIDLRAAVSRHPGLDEYEDFEDKALVEKVEEELGIGEDTFWHLMKEDALVEAMTNELLAEIDDEELKKRYWKRNRKVALQVVRILNVPTPTEISRFIAENEDRIERYYQEHRSEYRKPPRAAVRRIEVAVPPGATETERQALRGRTEELRQQAIAGDFGEVARQHSTDVLSASKGGSLPPVPERTMPQAFQLELGEVSEVHDSRRGFWFIELERLYPALDRSLDAPLQREIASKLIQQDGASPSLLAKASHALEALRDGDTDEVEAALEGARLDRFNIPLFSDNGSGRIPQLGKVPRVLKAVLALENENDVVEAPVLDRGYLYLVKLVEREEPDPVRFKAEKDVFRAQVMEAEGPRILWDFVNRKLDDSMQVDLRTLQREFGILQSDGTVKKLGDPAEQEVHHPEETPSEEGMAEQTPGPG